MQTTSYAEIRRQRITAANRAALALLDAYAEAIGEYPAEDDPETVAAYAVSHTDNMTLATTYATAANYDVVASMVEAIASKATEAPTNPEPAATEAAERAAVEAAATPEAYAEAMGSCEDATNLIAYGAYEALTGKHLQDTAEELEQIDRLMGYAAEIVQRDGAAHGIEWEEYRICADEPAPTYERYELLAYLGEPDAYDVDAIEDEATAYDPRTGRQVWTAFGDDLAAICERHELYQYAAVL